MNHLGISKFKSVQHFEPSQAKWVTILRNSPEIKIVAGSVHHFKPSSVDVLFESVVDSHLAQTAGPCSTRSSPVKKEPPGTTDVFSTSGHVVTLPSFSRHIVDLSNSDEEEESGLVTPSPSPAKKKTRLRSPSIPYLPLEQAPPPPPARMAEFPSVGAADMDVRLKWILENNDVGALSKRFESVFSCEFKSSTFHKHWSAWKWLRENGDLSNIRSNTLWKNLTDKVPRKNEDAGSKGKAGVDIVSLD